MDDRHRIGGATQIAARHRLADRAQPVAGDPQRGVRSARARLGIRRAAGRARRGARGPGGHRGARVRRRERHDAAQGDGGVVVGAAQRRRRAPARRQHDPPHAGRARRPQHRRAGVRTIPRARRRVRRGGPNRRCCSAPAVRPAPAGSRSRGRARHGSWSRCGSRSAPKRSSRTLAGFETAVEAVSFEDATASRPDLIVNATPLGAHGEELPLPPLDAATVAVDLLYRPAATPLQTRVRAAGGAAFGGLGLLLHQAGTRDRAVDGPAGADGRHVRGGAGGDRVRTADRVGGRLPACGWFSAAASRRSRAPTMPPAEDPWMNSLLSRSASC